MRRRSVVLAPVAILSSIALVACGSDDSDTPGREPQERENERDENERDENENEPDDKDHPARGERENERDENDNED